MAQELLSMKELEQEIGMSAPWVRRMERMNLIKPFTPKQQGAKRLYSKGDVINCLRLMALSVCGFRPEDARHYAELVEQFNRLTEPFLKKPRPRHIDGAVLLFDLRDIYPEGDPTNIKWNELERAINRKDGVYKFYRKEFDVGELLAEAFQLLFLIAQKAFDVKTAIQKAKRALQTAEHIEKEINGKFLPGVKSPFLSPGEYKLGVTGKMVASSLSKAFKVMEENA